MSIRVPVVAVLLLASLACLAFAPPSPASAADARRIAIAPFSANGQDDVRPVAALLPRLVASRLMALAGVDAPVLAPSDRPPADAAKEAGAGYLLEGGVARLGKGYSIDVTVSDLASGKPAGAFFASPANEDEIIPEVGRLSGEIAEKLFGAKPAFRSAPAPAAAAAPPPAAPPPVPPAGAPPAAAQPSPAAAAPSDAAWTPSKIRKAVQSDKVGDELYGVVSLGAEAGSDPELVAWGRNTLYFYRVKGAALVPWTRITRELNHHFLHVDVADLDGDGRFEILVTDRVNERLESFVLARRGDVYAEAAEKVPYYLAVLADRRGRRVVAGQSSGIDVAFQGKFHELEWAGASFKEGAPLPVSASVLPMASGGVLGLSAARLGGDARFLYSEEAGNLRILDEAGKTVSKGKTRFGWAGDSFEWGPFIQLEGRRASVKVRQPPRILPSAPGAPYLLAVQVKNPGVLMRIVGGETEGSRLSLYRWEDGEFVLRAESPNTDYQYTGADVVTPGGVRQGARVAASMIEQAAGIFKDRVSRLVLFDIE